jgi:UDP-glucose 4-epimerase
LGWARRDGTNDSLREAARQFLLAAQDGPWIVAWCAGAGTTGTLAESLQSELGALRAILEPLEAAVQPSRGAFFLASSAGAVYAGAGAPPYDESSGVCPLTAYGEAKLESEALVTSWSERSNTPTLIGRIANLYGPGQNVNKQQGLVTQICRSYLLGRPLSIYVSLDTLRDYFFAPDCAELIADSLARLRHESPSTGSLTVTKILASQRAITIGAVLGEMRRIFKSPPRYVVASSEGVMSQVRDLSLRSIVWSDLDQRTLTPFPVGVAITAEDLRRRLQSAGL